jgi:hypothetical protein
MADLNRHGQGCQWPFRRGRLGLPPGRGTVSDDFINEPERMWLAQKRRSAARRTALMILALALIVIFLAWLWDAYGPGGQAATTTTTAEQRAQVDGQRALADWGRFGVTGDLGTLKDSFWPNGPQYKLLAKEAEKHPKPIGPPAYTVTMSGVQVINARADERVLRGKVSFTRPGEAPQTYNWDVWMRRDDAAGGRWRLWTVRETAPR